MEAPLITIFVRHGMVKGKPCKYTGEEFSKKCKCPKHLRWSANGKQFRARPGRAHGKRRKKKRQN